MNSTEGNRQIDSSSARIEVQRSIENIGVNNWNSCITESVSPFTDYRFLHALEHSGCVMNSTGWQPMHLELRVSDRTVGVMPMYLKAHSMGEFVFDYQWAGAWENAGGNYYPKLQVCVPFTPVADRRILLAEKDRNQELEPLFTNLLIEIVEQNALSSAHLTFLDRAQCNRVCTSPQFLQRTDTQLHWQNKEYSSFNDFLATLSTKKRKNIRRERKLALQEALTIEWLTGADILERHWDVFYQCYLDTSARKWGRPYLNRRFFSLLSETMQEQILLILAKSNRRYVAGSLHFIGQDILFGRNWGCIEHYPFLHFELCYYQAIEYAIQHGLKTIEGGAQGNYKISRGYEPVTTYSAHYISNQNFRQAISNFLEDEEEYVRIDQEFLVQSLPFKQHD